MIDQAMRRTEVSVRGLRAVLGGSRRDSRHRNPLSARDELAGLNSASSITARWGYHRRLASVSVRSASNTSPRTNKANVHPADRRLAHRLDRLSDER